MHSSLLLPYRHTEAQMHTYNQTGVDLDCLSVITHEGLLPHSLVFSQRTNETNNVTQNRHYRIFLSFLPLINPHPN